jgi:hypothetical protein
MKPPYADPRSSKLRAVAGVVLLGFVLVAAACGHGAPTTASTSSRATRIRLAPTPTRATQIRPSAVIRTDRPVGLISADGGRVAYTIGPTAAACEQVSIWSPAKKSTLRVWPRRLTSCADYDQVFARAYPIYELALAGSVVGWSRVVGCGNSGCGSELLTAVLPRTPQVAADDDGTDYGPGDYAYFSPAGHGNIFGTDAGIRIELPGGKVHRCRPPGERIASIAGGWIAMYRGTSIAVLDQTCSLVRLLRIRANPSGAALLDGRRLVVARARQIDVYDVASGAHLLRTSPPPAGYFLWDISGGIAVLQHGRRVLVLRLRDGHSFLLWPKRGPVQAEIEPPGLYLAYPTADGRGRLELVPYAELERRLG